MFPITLLFCRVGQLKNFKPNRHPASRVITKKKTKSCQFRFTHNWKKNKTTRNISGFNRVNAILKREANMNKIFLSTYPDVVYTKQSARIIFLIYIVQYRCPPVALHNQPAHKKRCSHTPTPTQTGTLSYRARDPKIHAHGTRWVHTRSATQRSQYQEGQKK